ncbi:MAG: peroxiredoxin-like family protein [Hyphomicrobiaceae bacterium]
MPPGDVAKTLDDTLERLLQADAPLAERLAEYATILREINRPFAEAVDRLIVRLMEVGVGATAPNVGETLPPFLLPDEEGHLVALDHLLATGPLVVAFRRGHWCPYCQLATQALAGIQAAIHQRGARLVVLTPEREQFARQLKHQSGATFPILSDVDNGYAMAVGLAISVGAEMKEFMTVRGRKLDAYHGNAAWLLPIPATFVLDQAGQIVMRHVDPDYRRRAESSDILSALDVVMRQIP